MSTFPDKSLLPARPVCRPLVWPLRKWPWAVAVVAFLLLWQLGSAWKWAFVYPKDWLIPAARWIGNATKWLVNEASFGLFTFTELTRFIAAIIDFPYRVALGLLSTGLLSGQGSGATEILPPLSWIAVVAIVALLGYRFGGVRLALVAGLCFLYLALFGQWQSAMITLASILVAVPIGVAGGLLLGIASWRWRRFERTLAPLLDLMQTIPVFAYLVPILILFGFGPTAAVVATLIYAMPPMIRITTLALRGVPSEVIDLGHMVGCTRRQMTWRVMVPSARESLMVGVNQVIMLSLNMVIIASMIGAGGLGFDVLAALRRLDIGAGIESGLAIVVLAIALDRLSQAVAANAGQTHRAQSGFIARHGYLFAALAIIVVTALIGLALPAVQTYPEAAQLSTGSFWSEVVGWINVNFFDAFEAVKNAVLLNILVPAKRLLAGLPWIGVVAILGFAGWRLGGWRLALTCTVLSFLIAATGQWEKAMITVYLCGISVIAAALIGIPIGIVAAERARLWRWVQAIIDTLQTLPSFVYLMPAVMLFRVGDFTAMLAVVAYSVVPSIRYTALGLQKVDPRIV
ncbi:MAG: ABC transporter permease subunit, partial [Rhizobiaceae bacterium]